MAKANRKLSGSERAAVLLMSLGESDAAAVLKLMDPREVERVGTAMAALHGVSGEQVSDVMDQFAEAMDSQSPLQVDSSDYIRKMITNAVGGKRAESLIDRILHRGRSKSLDALKWMPTKAIADMLANEHPQIIAITLAHVDSGQAAEILGGLEPDQRNEVVHRIASLGDVQESALHELDRLVSKRSDAENGQRTASVAGMKTAAAMINSLDKTAEEGVLQYLRETDADMTQKIEDLMFSFEVILGIDDRAVQSILREVTNDVLIVALKGADTEIQEKIFKNMSKRAGEMLREDMSLKGPMRVSEVEAAQKEILGVVRRMVDEGAIVLPGKGEKLV
jgi:flagellar motor switch protein FliG